MLASSYGLKHFNECSKPCKFFLEFPVRSTALNDYWYYSVLGACYMGCSLITTSYAVHEIHHSPFRIGKGERSKSYIAKKTSGMFTLRH